MCLLYKEPRFLRLYSGLCSLQSSRQTGTNQTNRRNSSSFLLAQWAIYSFYALAPLRALFMAFMPYASILWLWMVLTIHIGPFPSVTIHKRSLQGLLRPMFVCLKKELYRIELFSDKKCHHLINWFVIKPSNVSTLITRHSGRFRFHLWPFDILGSSQNFKSILQVWNFCMIICQYSSFKIQPNNLISGLQVRGHGLKMRSLFYFFLNNSGQRQYITFNISFWCMELKMHPFIWMISTDSESLNLLFSSYRKMSGAFFV